MSTSGTTQTFSYSLTGLDPACSSGAGTAPGSCGMHIHTGSTCTADAGGHYYTGTVTTDPWTNAYTAQEDGTASASVTVETGGTSSDINGHSFVVHAYDGTRIACAILGATSEVTVTASGFVPYYSYKGDLAVAGTVGPMTTSGTTQTFYYSLTGVDPACSDGAGTAGNSCGVHIHSGTTCTDNAGGHYFTGAVTEDPWASIAYTSTAANTAAASVTVDTGAGSWSLVGRAFVVHAYDGSRIGCAILGTGGGDAALVASGFVPYFSYTGDLAVAGTVGPMTSSGTAQTFTYSFSGVDPECNAGRGNAPGSCGMHIHTGSTCTADAGGHYYTGSITEDPWMMIHYTTDADGRATGAFTVSTGGTSSDVVGHAFVVHAYDGTRIACAILGATSEITLTASGFVPYYSYTGDLAVGGRVGAITTIGTTQYFRYSLTGIDEACYNGAGSAANSCGVHIHSGTTCTADAGGHHYTDPVTDDPWADVAYTALGGNRAVGYVYAVNTGSSSHSLVGHALIVHAHDGSRIGAAPVRQNSSSHPQLLLPTFLAAHLCFPSLLAPLVSRPQHAPCSARADRRASRRVVSCRTTTTGVSWMLEAPCVLC